jgi:hydrogenase maturation protease
MVVHAPRMAFVSLTDPPAALLEAAGTCHNIGCWPVLVGDPQQTDTLLASPIILPDYPQIAPESPGDLFDGCEIDEILSLRIRTLTDAEKQQAASVDDRVRQMLERTDGLARDQLMNLHGAVRNLQPIQKERQHA